MALTSAVSSQPVFYNMDKWIQANKDSFTPPICNKVMHNAQLLVFFLGGPNCRTDYHLSEGEEFYYMIKGSMTLKVLTQGEFQEIIINEGEMFMLPSHVAHSPQRKVDTVGLVVERERKPSEYDCLRWYVRNSKEVLYEHWFHLIDIGQQLGPIIQEYQASEQYKTSRPVPGAFTKDAPFRADEARKLEKAMSLKKWIQDNKTELREKGYKRVFDDSYQSDVTVYGSGNHDSCTGLHETFVWQIKGTRTIHIQRKPFKLEAGDTLLIPSDAEYQSRGSPGSYSMFVTMNPHERTKF